MSKQSLTEIAKSVLELEAAAVHSLASRIDGSFSDACELVLKCEGRVVVAGIGKSGHIAGKIASTLASTGTPAFFVHPGEASHGDLGMITPTDLVLAISNSGETPEILTILPIIKRMGIKLIAFCGKCDSTMARQADVVIDIGVEKEACPHNLAPTASTTAALAMGDALAIATLESRGFTLQDFARSHPGGVLGRRLLLYVSDIMHQGDGVPLVNVTDRLRDALVEMNAKGLGMTGIIDDQEKLVGIYTDGDLRRSLGDNVDVQKCQIESLMTSNPVTMQPDTLAAEAVQTMETHSINGLFVVDREGKVLGALNMLDFLRAGVV